MTDAEPGQEQLQMMAFLDDELSLEDRRSFIERCYADPELAAELANFRRIGQITNSMRLREPEDFEYERFFAQVSARVERRMGFVFLAIGLIILGIAVLHTLVTADLPLPIKIGAVLALMGLGLLITSVCRMRLRLARLDRYQGVRR